MISKFAYASSDEKIEILKIWKNAILDLDPSLVQVWEPIQDTGILLYDGIIMGTARMNGFQIDMDIVILTSVCIGVAEFRRR